MTNARIAKQLAALEFMTVRKLQERFAELFGDAPSSHNRIWLVRRIAWRIQANAFGGLSERAKQRAAELANESDLRLSPPKISTNQRGTGTDGTTNISTANVTGDERIPLPGTILVREYKGRKLQVRVVENGFEFQGEIFRSLSAVAKSITGTHCNGFLFFRLNRSKSNG